MIRATICLALATGTLALAGCSTQPQRRSNAKTMEWTGQAEREGHGGFVEKVDGIDVYRGGEPNGKYRVLGVAQMTYIREGKDRNNKKGAEATSELLLAVREKGGDAAVILDENAKVVELASNGNAIPIGRFWINTGSTKVKERVELGALIIKYVP